MSENEKPLDIVVLNFSCAITNKQMGQLGGNWELYDIPIKARDRLLRVLRKSIADMTGPDGRILSELANFEEFVNRIE